MSRRLMALLQLALIASACRPSSPPPETPSPPRADAGKAALPPPPEPLAALLRRISVVAVDEPGIQPDEEALAKDIQAYGPAAIPYVIPLLESDEDRIRRFAGYVLRDMEGLTDANLDALIAARRRGDGWIPPAIASVGSPRAIQFLVDDLRANPESMTQLTWALQKAGAPAAAPLARLLQPSQPVNEVLARAMCEVFHGMANRADSAIDILENIAKLESAPLQNRWYAIAMLGCIGPSARRSVPALRALASSAPEKLRQTVDSAIVAMGSADAVPILVATLHDHPTIAVLRDIAAMKEEARDAGPAVTALLSSPDRKLRVAAARTLGFIGYDKDVPALAKQLADEDDWQIVYVAAESLGRLGATAALPSLDAVATRHWYPPVRESARRAAEVIRGHDHYAPTRRESNFAFQYFDYEHVPAPKSGSQPPFVHGSNELTANALKNLSYDAEIVSYGPGGERKTVTRQAPTVGLRTPNGSLVGADRGEWGGELMYLDRTLPPAHLLDDNVEGIHQLGTTIVIVAGLAHMLSNHGALYRAKRVGNGKYEVTRWKVLPGAPRASGMLRDGRLFVSCEGGDIVVKTDGGIEMAAPGP